ncbi:TauD/TfdA dioxygenase family protein [Mycobacterium sp. NPDC051804]|uniref:TauD/TfdA dioxygenase family protein n=1 Tax=Mycobacterium sp. NPDC051804 TaxID=3364295 RepID=UPI00378CBC1D
MHYTPLEPCGAVVKGVHVDALRQAHVDILQRLLAEHGVLIFREQHIDDAAFTRFLRSFGELMFTTGETPVDGHPDLNVVSNVGRETPPRSNFHVDTSYVRTPPAYTALRAVDVPELGGQTLFSNQYRAYERLPNDIRRDVGTRSIKHVVTGVELGEDDEKAAVHPVVRKHPVSARRALYLSSPARCATVSGLTPEDGRALVEHLVDHCTRDENVLRHEWMPGDVVMWDNRCVMHKADHTGVVGRRVLHRGMVADIDRTCRSDGPE